MKLLKKICVAIGMLLLQANAYAQSNEVIFTAQEFIQKIKENHPIAQIANIEIDKAKANLLASKGNFDPNTEVEFNNKTFDGKNYYQYFNPELKIPTPVGIDIKTGLESNTGKFISSELTSGNSSYLGVEVALAKGLWIDKRRAILKQAKILLNQSKIERDAAINDLLANAWISYYNWTSAYLSFKNYANFIQIATDRLKLVRIAHKNGDRSVADTLEAYTQYQNLLLLQNESLIKFNTASFDLSTYLWKSKDSVWILPANYLPDTVSFLANDTPLSVSELLQQSNQNNPNILTYNYKLSSLDVEKKLKFQSLLPTLNLKANVLTKDYYAFSKFDNLYFENNNKWGVYFKMPLWFREARGEYNKIKLKINETNFALKDKINQTNNKISAYCNESQILYSQIDIAKQATFNYNQLLRAEITKYFNGESSLFVVNSREMKYLEMVQKQIELRAKYYKAKYMAQWAAGMLK